MWCNIAHFQNVEVALEYKECVEETGDEVNYEKKPGGSGLRVVYVCV